MAGMLQMRRSRGAFSGFLLVLLGLWGALIPFIGPYFHFAYTPDTAWTYNSARLWLEILPGAAVFLGERVTLVMVAGGLLILAGVAVASTGRPAHNDRDMVPHSGVPDSAVSDSAGDGPREAERR